MRLDLDGPRLSNPDRPRSTVSETVTDPRYRVSGMRASVVVDPFVAASCRARPLAEVGLPGL